MQTAKTNQTGLCNMTVDISPFVNRHKKYTLVYIYIVGFIVYLFVNNYFTYSKESFPNEHDECSSLPIGIMFITPYILVIR